MVGSLSVTDEDTDQSHTFIIKESTDDVFKIGSDGKSIAKATGGRMSTSQVYSVVVTATDNSTPAFSVSL